MLSIVYHNIHKFHVLHIIEKLINYSRTKGIKIPYSANTEYINTKRLLFDCFGYFTPGSDASGQKRAGSEAQMRPCLRFPP